MKKTFIFDLDGTLLDSLEDIAVSMNIVLKELGLSEIEHKRYGYLVGGGVDVLVENICKELHVKLDTQDIVKRFKNVYEGKMQKNTKPYDGIVELLKELKNHNLAVLSNKPHDMTKQYVQSFFPDTFSQIFGQRAGIPKKPNPQAVDEIISNLHVKKEDVYFIGDTNIDMQTANNANVKSIGVLWGFRDEKELRENNATFIVSHPSEILDIVND